MKYNNTKNKLVTAALLASSFTFGSYISYVNQSIQKNKTSSSEIKSPLEQKCEDKKEFPKPQQNNSYESSHRSESLVPHMS